MSGSTFSLQVAAFAAKAKGNANQVVRKVAIDCVSSIVLKSPVDTGRFRANWNLSLGNIDETTSDATDKGGADTIANAAVSVSDSLLGQTVYITNALPYAQRLEYGYSKQAPVGMVRITVAEFQGYIDRAVPGLT